MKLKNTGYPLPKTRFFHMLLHSEKGQIEWVVGLFSIVFMAIILCAGIQIEVYSASSLYMEDALAVSNLASALIDVEEYGISNNITLNDPVEHYEIYKQALKENLGLNDDFEGSESALISGQVTIDKYIIYNVSDAGVEIYTVSSEGEVSREFCPLDEVVTPDGTRVESTGIYSRISFPVKGFFNTTVTARKGKLVDIVRNE